MREYVRMLVVLTAFALFSGLILTATYQITAPYIAIHAQEALQNSLQEVLGAVSNIEERKIGQNIVYLASNSQGENFIALKSCSNGYGGPVNIMVGMNLNQKKITKLSVLDHTETPGLGTVIEEDNFKGQYNDLIFSQQSSVDLVTGATFSTAAVKTAVEKAVNFVEKTFYDGQGNLILPNIGEYTPSDIRLECDEASVEDEVSSIFVNPKKSLKVLTSGGTR